MRNNYFSYLTKKLFGVVEEWKTLVTVLYLMFPRPHVGGRSKVHAVWWFDSTLLRFGLLVYRITTPHCHCGDGGFNSRTDRWGWYKLRTVAYREGRKNAIAIWSNTSKEQKCLSRIVVRADDEFE